MSDLRAAKADCRVQLRARVAALSPAERQRQSALICTHVRDLAQFQQAHAAVLYRPLPTEVDVGALWDWVVESQRPVFFPQLDTQKRSLRFLQVNRDTQWRQTRLRIWEPVNGTELLDAGLATAAIIVPGLGFTRAGDRIGRGAGYYDRALVAAGLQDRLIRIGVGFDEQIVDRLPVGPSDVRMHAVVSASGACVAVTTSLRPMVSD